MASSALGSETSDSVHVSETLYAIKKFRKRRKTETEREYVKKLMNEYCVSSTLHHANVIETVDLIQDEQQEWCEVMEYMGVRLHSCPKGVSPLT